MFPSLNQESLFEYCQKVAKDIEGDFGGGSPTPKVFVMAYLASLDNLQSYLEIGVYRGRSLFPVAFSIARNRGYSIGVDPYRVGDALERDVEEPLGRKIDEFLHGLDFESIFRAVVDYRDASDFGQTVRLYRGTANDFFQELGGANSTFDLVHIDGNHDTRFVEQDFENSLKYVSQGGFIVFDDIDWPSVREVYDQAKLFNPVVFETEQFGILIVERPSLSRDYKIERLGKKLSGAYSRAKILCLQPTDHIPTVAVGVLVYNQVQFIRECLQSVLMQEGDFRLKVVICDDASDDGTSHVIEELIADFTPRDSVSVVYQRNSENLGVMGNLQLLVSQVTDSDYFTFCEGDDFYLDGRRLARHLSLHLKHPENSMSYNTMIIKGQEGNSTTLWDEGPAEEPATPEKLARNNFIGNLNCSFYNSQSVTALSGELFAQFAGDWMLNIVYSQFGEVGRINLPMNVYRKHGGGIWSGLNTAAVAQNLRELIPGYNRFLNFSYDASFSQVLAELGSSEPEPRSITIIDDISPHPLSGFRYQEFTSILKSIPGSELVSTGESAQVLGVDKIDDLIIDYKRRNPDLATSVRVLTTGTRISSALLYCDFLGNAYHNLLPHAESNRIPFVFTLYPGGVFALDEERSDSMLSAVFGSAYFEKVIVTQSVTRDYLLDRKFCKEDQIEFVFGVVVPESALEFEGGKQHFGFDKKTVDICFVAHKYTPTGEDKGYGVFLDVARRLSELHDDVNFHVVGPWSPEILDVQGIQNLTFHGVLDNSRFDEFYRDKDIIVSPNKNGMITPGSFDGFPTATVTDASLRKVAMLVTDPLGLNEGYFEDGLDIVIIRETVEDIVGKIEVLIANPAHLRSLGERGQLKSREIYSIDNQIGSRLRILREALETSGRGFRTTRKPSHFRASVWRSTVGILARFTPVPLKKVRRKLLRIWRFFVEL